MPGVNITLKAREARQRILAECRRRWHEEPAICIGCEWFDRPKYKCKQADVVDGMLKVDKNDTRYKDFIKSLGW